MEMLFHAGRYRGARHVRAHLCVYHVGELGARGDLRHCERGHVHAHAGGYLLCLYFGECQIPVLQKEIHVRGEIGEGKRGCAHSSERH